jgi:hypothetical protein
MGHALGAAATPYIIDGLAGAFIGLLLAVAIYVLRRASRPSGSPKAPKQRRQPTSTSPADVPASTLRAPAPALTKAELHALRLKVRKGVLAAMRELNGRADRDNILAKARSIGGFTTRELEAPSQARYRNKHPRQIDHDLSWALTDLKRDGLAINPARGIWALTDAALVEQEAPLSEESVPERLAELRAMPYDEYLRTPEWKKTRAAALVRADHRCALDPNHTGKLDVHHRHYERRGAELPSDLIVLCHACHQLHHGEGRAG